jgi:hypothetical protein
LNAPWTYDINLAGSVELARRARQADVEGLVFASSCAWDDPVTHLGSGRSLDDLLDNGSVEHPWRAYFGGERRDAASPSPAAADALANRPDVPTMR